MKHSQSKNYKIIGLRAQNTKKLILNLGILCLELLLV